jgi:hypothetical protein
MKKVIQAASKYLFAGFSMAVLALLMSLTYSALARIFPDSLINRIWGLVMFDIAAMAWAIAFVFQSETTSQYATAAIGFVVGFIGTLGMVAAEVILSSGMVQAQDIGQWMVYGFIIVTALHAGLTYAHHATGSEIHGQIEIGIARGEIITEARKTATAQLDENKRELSRTITQDILSQVKRDLGLIEADPQMPFLPKEATTALPAPLAKDEPKSADYPFRPE